MPRGLVPALCGTPLRAFPATAAADPNNNNSPKLRQAVSVAGIQEHMEALQAIARQKNCTTAQLAIAWVASRGHEVIPLIGAKRRDQLRDALGALDVRLSPADIAHIESAMPAEAVAGEVSRGHVTSREALRTGRIIAGPPWRRLA